MQTLFMQLTQVGKEQAIQKDAAHLAQSIQGGEIARESEETTKTVSETRDLENGPDAVKDEEQKYREGREEQHGDRDKSEASDKREFFRDPDLGTKIDISG